MSVSATSAIGQITQQTGKPRQTPSSGGDASFGQQLASHSAQVHGHHHNHVSPAQPVTLASTASAGSASGGLASSLMKLLG
jgi:hypothetical protein